MIGEAAVRRDGPRKVSGSATYAYEHRFADTAVGYIVPATIAKGRILAIDTSEALRCPGVLDVLTFRNTPRMAPRQPRAPGRPFVRPMPALQSDRVEFFGEPVAFVVAETFETAREAAMFVHVTYAPQDAVFRLDDAPAERTYVPTTAYGGFATDSVVGDLEGAIDGAHFRVDAEYRTPHQFALPLEPQSAIAAWKGPLLRVWASVQIVSTARTCLSVTLGIPESDIELDSAFVGGGFGSKLRIHEETILAAVASRRLGRPVKVAQTRRQSFSLVGHRGEMKHHVRLGADHMGRLTAIGHDVNMQGHEREEYVEQVATVMRSLYAAPNRLSRHRVTNLDVVMTEAVRAPGEGPGLLVIESAMDELAHAMGMDPIELRIANEPVQDPEKGLPFGNRGLIQCMRHGAQRFGWSARSARPASRLEGSDLIGMGMAGAIRTHFQGATEVEVAITPAGMVVVRSDMTDIGTGTYTILAQVAAEALEVPEHRIEIELAHSSLPVSAGSGGSYGASNTCMALYNACRSLREIVMKGVGEIGSDDFLELARRKYPEGVNARGSIPAMGADPRFKRFSLHTYGATFAEVAVNSITGEVKVRRMLGVFDAGRIVNPMTARSQLIGGMLWGMSSALLDGAEIDPVHGNVVNCDLAEYLVPVHADIPEIDAVMLDSPDDNANELGIKGVGELGLCGTGAAVANAVFNATGVRVRDFPIRLDAILPRLVADRQNVAD